MPETLPKRRRKRRPERRDEILDAAIDLFYVRGYVMTSLEDVANAVGIAGPSIYRHFGSKLEILDAAVQQGAEHVLRAHAEVTTAGGPPEDVLARLVRDIVTAVQQRPKLVTVALRERDHLPAESRALFDRSLRMQTDEWVRLLRQIRPTLAAEDARLTVRVVLAMIHGSAQHLPVAPTDAAAELLTNIALAALLRS
jgi:AcrR family transcriptional regulator